MLAGTCGTQLCAARFLESGALDVAFGTAGKVISTLESNVTNTVGAAMQADGKLVMLLMDGFTISGGDFVYTEPDQNWKIVGP